MVGFINFLNAMGGRTELGKGHEELGDFGVILPHQAWEAELVHSRQQMAPWGGASDKGTPQVSTYRASIGAGIW